MKILYEKSKDSRVTEFNQLIVKEFPEFLTEKNPDLVLVAGGDGAMLHSMARNMSKKVLFLGKSMGRLNFLMNNFDNDKKIITELKNDRLKYDVCKSRSLAVFINDIFVGQAVNEVILGDSVMSYNEFTIRTETGELDGLDFRGGGICISTPIGSTAFNFNNNGSILPLHSELLSVTGLMADRYINDIVSLQEIKIETGKVKLFLDGIDRGMIKNGEVVAIIPGEEIDLVFLDKKHFLNRRIEFSNRLRKV